MATKCSYDLSRSVFIFFFISPFNRGINVFNWPPRNMGQSRAETVSHNLSFIERRHVTVTSHDVDDSICLKLVCLFFVCFFLLLLLRALSLPQPCRQEGGKCYFTAQTRRSQYWEIIRKKKKKQRLLAFLPSSMHTAVLSVLLLPK